jgi:hypothetical protein
MSKERGTYLPSIVGDKVMMPADLKRLHKYMLDVEHIGIISDEVREVVEELWLRAGTQAAAEEATGVTIMPADSRNRIMIKSMLGCLWKSPS